jgi:hypothetical protein
LTREIPLECFRTWRSAKRTDLAGPERWLRRRPTVAGTRGSESRVLFSVD